MSADPTVLDLKCSIQDGIEELEEVLKAEGEESLDCLANAIAYLDKTDDIAVRLVFEDIYGEQGIPGYGKTPVLIG